MRRAGESKSAIWQLVEGWGTEGSDWGGRLLQALQHLTQPAWRGPCRLPGQDKGLDEAQALCQELHWEAEAKLMNILKFMTSRRKSSGHASDRVCLCARSMSLCNVLLMEAMALTTAVVLNRI